MAREIIKNLLNSILEKKSKLDSYKPVNTIRSLQKNNGTDLFS